MNGGLDPDPTRNCRICNEKVFVCQKDAMGGPYIANNGICNGCLAPGDIEMAKKTKLDWQKIWKEFYKWYDKAQFDYDWDKQQAKIQRLVESALK